jgi:hypothetical protein
MMHLKILRKSVFCCAAFPVNCDERIKTVVERKKKIMKPYITACATTTSPVNRTSDSLMVSQVGLHFTIHYSSPTQVLVR